MMMTNKQMVVLTVFAVAAVAAQADGWHFSAGPAWRSRVKTEMHGAVPVPTETARTEYSDSYSRNPGQDGQYSRDEISAVPDPANAGDELWAVGISFTETTTTPGESAAGIDSTETDGSLGLKTRFGYDVWEMGPVSVALDLRFAGYWNLRSSASGYASGGTRTVRTGNNYFLFEDGPSCPDDDNFDGWLPSDVAQTVFDPNSDRTELLPGHRVGSRLRADLYQLGLGPTVSWRVCPWIDAYAGAAILCNIASLDFEVGATSSSETQCRVGFGAEVGLVANVTENLGLFAEVGYEWIDSFDASAGGLAADVDFSSLVISAGLQVRF